MRVLTSTLPTVFNFTLTLGAYLGQGELHGGSLGREPPSRVYVLSNGVHTQHLISPHPSPPEQEMSPHPQL